MKKALFFMFLIKLATACTNRPALNEKSKGEINHISVIIDDDLWSGEVGDSLRNKLASPILGLPEEEPLFSINQYPLKLLEGFSSGNRTILVVKKALTSKYEVVQSKSLASPQHIYISGSTVADIVHIIEQKTPQIIQLIKKAELAEMKRRLQSDLISFSASADIGINLAIPKDYKIVRRAEKFFWFKKDLISGNVNLLIYKVPAPAGKMLPMRQLRDSIGAKYIHGLTANSNMVTEGSFTPYASKIILAEKLATETRGTWELKNDFMSGPYLNYAILDSTSQQALIIEGFCYAPSKKKRDLMFELETILRSISFTND